MNDGFNADVEWYPESNRIVITPDTIIDYNDIYEMNGHNYIISDYKYDKSSLQSYTNLELTFSVAIPENTIKS